MTLCTPAYIYFQQTIWILEKFLHKGKFAEISVLSNNSDDKRVVMKRNVGYFCQQRNSDETATLKALEGNENVIAFLGTIEDSIVMEFASHGNLKDYIELNGIPSRSDFWVMYTQLANGLSFIHQNHIAHRDLKLQNILITDYGILKICDFNLSKKFVDQSGNRIKFHDSIGTPRYQSPELLRDREYDGERNDIWALGVVLLQLLTNEESWSRALQTDHVYQQFLSETFPATISGEERKFLMNFLENDPKSRRFMHD